MGIWTRSCRARRGKFDIIAPTSTVERDSWDRETRTVMLCERACARACACVGAGTHGKGHGKGCLTSKESSSVSVSMSKSRSRVRSTNSVPHRGSSFREAVERHRLSCCFRSICSVETLKPCSAPIASEARAISAESVARNTWPRNWWAFISAKASCSGRAEHRRERWPLSGALAPQASPMRMCRPTSNHTSGSQPEPSLSHGRRRRPPQSVRPIGSAMAGGGTPRGKLCGKNRSFLRNVAARANPKVGEHLKPPEQPLPSKCQRNGVRVHADPPTGAIRHARVVQGVLAKPAERGAGVDLGGICK
eukprot:scaffold109233_cov60-Phaeocystis_antarctica.AAC.3